MTTTPTPAEALRAGIDLINGDLTGAEWKRACRYFIKQATAALAAAPQPAPEDDWRNDPSADERWNAGCDYAMTALCKLLCIDTDDVTWDAATEELEGDVLAVLGNILTVRFGDDWRKAAPQSAPVDREIDDAFLSLCEAVGVPATAFAAQEYRARTAPDREALVEVIKRALVETPDDSGMEDYAKAIADALLARGLRLPTGKEVMPDASARPIQQPDTSPRLTAGAQVEETMAWAVLGEDGKMVAINYDRMTAQHLCNPGERVVRVAIRVVEGGDDAA